MQRSKKDEKLLFPFNIKTMNLYVLQPVPMASMSPIQTAQKQHIMKNVSLIENATKCRVFV